MLIDPFLKYIGQEKRYSKHTLLAYTTDLLQFQDFMSVTYELDLAAAKYIHVRDYIAHLMEGDVGASSIGRKLSTLRSFYKYLCRQQIIDSSPMNLIKAPKAPKRLPVFVDEQKMDSLLDSEEIFSDSFGSMRDRLIIETLFGTGIRLSELIGLKESDIDIYANTLKVLGKGNKERIVPMTKPLVLQVESYLLEKSKQNFHNKVETLIVTDKGNKLNANFVYTTVKRYLSMVSTQEKLSPHVLRHSYATSLLNRGADLNAIKELLGHASLAATQVYTHNSIETLKTIYKQAHPKA
ncbi:MAG: Tyrosine recombinase XerC [Pedobacter sp.]|jgi:integrase/recombinase XerC|nr:Tyrosine recombinase XerC [Pedobacter sp.]